MNKAVGQFDGYLSAPDNSSGEIALDIEQDGSAVAGWDASAGSLLPIGVNGLTLGTDRKANLDYRDQISMSGGTLAVLNPQSGQLWAMRYSPDGSLGSLASIDRGAPKLASVGAGAAMTVGQDGTIYTVSAANGLTTTTPRGIGFTSSRKRLDALPPGSLSIASVGTEPVVLDQEPGAGTATLLLHGVDQLQLDDVAQAKLQQSGPDTPGVLVASSSGLYSVALHGTARVSRLIHPSYLLGAPAQPVQLRGCVFAAWAGSPGSAASSCGTATPQLRPQLSTATNLVFRVNRQQVVLNDMQDGQVWDLDSGTPAELDDWSKIMPPTGAPKPSPGSPQPDPGQPTKPPTAEKDQLGARAGRTTALYVLDNDSDPGQKVLTVATVGQPSSPDLKLAISSDGQTVLLTLPVGASGSYHFQYTNSDGGPRPSQPAIVDVTVAPTGSYRPPTQRKDTKQTWATPINGSVTIPATAGWRNTFDGDATVLTAAKASAGTVTTTADGSLIYSASDEPGAQHISYTVSDGGSTTTTTKTLDVNVQPESATPVPAVAQPDYAQGLVGRPLVIYPLDNDLPGSDPSRLNATLSLAGTVGQQKNLQVSTDLQRGTITVTALAAGSYLLKYRAGYGTARPSDEAQIRLSISGRPTGSIVAGPDTAVIHGEAPLLLDVLANDYDPGGNLLDVVQAVAGPGDRPLQVAVVQGRWLRINATQNLAQAGEGRISYLVSDGLTTPVVGQVTVNEFPAIAPDQPITEPDFATVRAGGSTTVAVLDNDIDAGGDPITLAQNVGGAVPPGQLAVTGLDGSTGAANGTAYVAGNLVRYVAPPAAAVTSQRQVQIGYRAEAAGTASNGLVTVTINPPANARTNPDQAPTPADLEARVGAGGTVTIPVPTAGADPDGDTVTVTGLGSAVGHSPAPRLGRLLSYTANSLTYQAYPFAGNQGTDQFSYQVVDPSGLPATATVHIAVIPPDVLPAPVPHPIAVTAAPGEQLRLHVISSAYVDFPQGDPPILQDPRGLNPNGPAQVRLDQTPGWLDIQVPQRSEVGTVTLVYGVIGDLGQTASASITVMIKPGFHPPPIAVDQFAHIKPGATTIRVNLLQGDSDPTGGTLSVVAPAGATGGMLTATLTADPQVLPYVIQSTDGARATANVYVPAGKSAAPYWNGKSIAITKGSVTVPIKNYVTDPQGKQLRLGTTAQIWSSPSVGLKVVPQGADALILTAISGYNGPAAVSFVVSDGPKLNTPDARSAIISVPVQVGTPTPVLRCPATPIDVVQGASAGTPIDIAAQCHVWLPDPSAAPLDYHLSWQGNPISDVSFGNNDRQRPVVVAGHNARANARGSITVTAVGSGGSARFTVIVTKAKQLVVSPIAVTGVHAGSTVQLDIGAYANSPFGRDAVSVVYIGQLSGQPASAQRSGKQSVSITPHAGVSGLLTFRYTVTDVDSGDANRQVNGQISVEVIDRPGAPTAVTPRPGVRSRQAILTWVAPDNHGSPIDGYTVAYTGPGAGTANCAASPCTIDGLTNGNVYYFTVRAHNAVDFGPYSAQSGPDEPDAPPPPVTGFRSSQPLDHRITLSWNEDKPDGTPVDHYSISWPGGLSQISGQVLSTTITGLSNDQTTFQIVAYNAAGHSIATTTTGWPTGAPSTPTGLQIGYANDTGSKTRTIVLTWDPDPPNGEGPTSYAVTRSGTPVSCAEHQPTQTSCTDQPPVGSTYTYQVAATNQPGLTDPADHTSPAASISYQVASTPDQMPAPVAHPPAAGDPDGYATVSFTTSASNGASPVVHCAYTTDGSAPTGSSASCGSWSGYSANGGTDDTKPISSLPNGGTIRFAVWEDNQSNTGAQNSAGPISGPSNQVVTNGPPGAPPNGSCNQNGNNLNVNWTPATPTGSRTITSYRISLDNGGISDIGNVTSYNFGSRPSDGSGHTVQVYAFDGQDQGPGLNITGPSCTDPAPPPPPSSTATISWGGAAASSKCNGDTTCRYINLSVANFAPGRYSVQWYDDRPDNGVWFTDTITVGSGGTGSSNNNHWFGYGGKGYAIWVIVNGATRSNTINS